MGAGGMAAEMDVLGIAAVSRDVAMDPGDGVGAIIELRRKSRGRRVAVGRRHEDRGYREQRRRHEGYPFLVPGEPTAAMQEAEHRQRAAIAPLRHENIELLPIIVGPIGEIGHAPRSGQHAARIGEDTLEIGGAAGMPGRQQRRQIIERHGYLVSPVIRL